MEKIKGGYYIKARVIQLSDIATAPPHIRETWDWLLREANHAPYKNIKRGEVLCTYTEIIEGLHWLVGWRKMTYTKHHMTTAMRYLKKHLMVTTRRTTRGMVVTICNYSHFQNPLNYKNQQGEQQRTPTGEQQRKPHAPCHDIQEERSNKKEETHTECGRFKNVKLTDMQYKELVLMLGETRVKKYINLVDSYCKTQEKTYPNYQGAIEQYYNKAVEDGTDTPLEKIRKICTKEYPKPKDGDIGSNGTWRHKIEGGICDGCGRKKK